MPLWLIEDGAPAHLAGFTKSRQEGYGMPKFDWPASSPGLGPVENIWVLLGSRLGKRNPRPSGKEEVKAAIMEEWDKITVGEIQRVVDNMPGS